MIYRLSRDGPYPPLLRITAAGPLFPVAIGPTGVSYAPVNDAGEMRSMDPESSAAMPPCEFCGSVETPRVWLNVERIENQIARSGCACERCRADLLEAVQYGSGMRPMQFVKA